MAAWKTDYYPVQIWAIWDVCCAYKNSVWEARLSCQEFQSEAQNGRASGG